MDKKFSITIVKKCKRNRGKKYNNQSKIYQKIIVIINSNSIGGRIISIHLRSDLRVQLEATVDGSGVGVVLDDGNDVKEDGAHVEEHARK